MTLLGPCLAVCLVLPSDIDGIPPPAMKGADNIPEANVLFHDATTCRDKLRTEKLLQLLLNKDPTSNKVSEAAYLLGDIYESDAFRCYAQAALYFERCVDWNRNTRLNARLRAARLYEQQLNERAKAIKLYQEVVSHELDIKRVEEAQKRLTDLGAKK